MGTPIKWENANFTWNNNPFTWDEVVLVKEVISGAIEDQVWNQFDTDKKKRLVKLICKVQGKTIKEEKEIQNYKIKVSDIKLLAEKVLGIEVLTENVKF
tara:strand:- start:116 stop:412 length:297 start_codon:yes stop_codon:yes gene_type:complete